MEKFAGWLYGKSIFGWVFGPLSVSHSHAVHIYEVTRVTYKFNFGNNATHARRKDKQKSNRHRTPTWIAPQSEWVASSAHANTGGLLGHAHSLWLCSHHMCAYWMDGCSRTWTWMVDLVWEAIEMRWRMRQNSTEKNKRRWRIQRQIFINKVLSAIRFHFISFCFSLFCFRSPNHSIPSRWICWNLKVDSMAHTISSRCMNSRQENLGVCVLRKQKPYHVFVFHSKSKIDIQWQKERRREIHRGIRIITILMK